MTDGWEGEGGTERPLDIMQKARLARGGRGAIEPVGTNKFSDAAAEARVHSQRGIATYPGPKEPWRPTVREGETEAPLVEWVGQAIGAASMCWVGGTGALEFDSTEAARIHGALMQRIEQALEEAINRRNLAEPTTRELLNELRTRAENWAGTSGSGYLADRVDDMLMGTVSDTMLDGRREP